MPCTKLNRTRVKKPKNNITRPVGKAVGKTVGATGKVVGTQLKFQTIKKGAKTGLDIAEGLEMVGAFL